MSIAREVLDRLCKWRFVFGSWQCGTRSEKDGEIRAVKDHREVTILLRVEVTALAALLIKKGVFTVEEFTDQIVEEAEALDKGYEERFPGFRSSHSGMVMSPPQVALDTMRRFGFPD